MLASVSFRPVLIMELVVCAIPARLRMFEYMLQSHESSWGFPSTLCITLNLLLVNVKKSSAEQIKTKLIVLISAVYKESIKTSLEGIYSWINFNTSIYFPISENMTNCIKISKLLYLQKIQTVYKIFR